MKEKKFEFNYTVYQNIDELPEDKQLLLKEAQQATRQAYAPYSNFHVGGAAKLVNGQVVHGTNQENASFPAGLCAERVLLSMVTMLFPDTAIDTVAISYNSDHVESDHPISPCGICRQSFQEFESRVQHPIKLLLAGMKGEVYEIESAGHLLPLAFTNEELL